MFRKRIGLSQDEMAFLLGCRSGSQVSRYEHNTHQPSLRSTLVYELIFGVEAGRLFTGLHEEIEKETNHRVQLLVQKLTEGKQDQLTARKLAVLKEIASDSGAEPDQRDE